MNGETKGDIIIEEGWQAVTSAEDLFLKDLPPCVSLLPNDWEGETTRVKMTFAVSRQAVNNEKFDVQGFIKAKFDNTLKAIRHRRGIDELRLTRRISVTIDPMSGREKVQIYIHIEYANE